MKKVLATTLLTMFLIGIVGIIAQRIDYERSDMAQSNALEIASVPTSTTAETTVAVTSAGITEATTESVTQVTEAPIEIDEYAKELFETDIAALAAVNKDVIGWIVIPDSSISYPLLQGDNNTHYLNYAWDGKRNAGGSIYLDYRSNPDFSDFHSIIYGHRMYNDSMFNSLKYYNDIEYLKAHPSVYIANEEGVLRYDAFAAYDADAINGHSYRLGLKDEYGQQAYINYCLKNSVIDSGIKPSAKECDRVLTLSTCSEDGSEKTRWVVHFVLSYKLEK